ncbi:MAG TPA: hypothetical protein VF804_12855, partial [Holophagaceae bacterium]
ETRHQILTVTNGVPDKLICGNCRSVHKFRMAKPAPEPRASRIPATAKAGAAPRSGGSASLYQQLLAQEQGGGQSRPYAVSERWEEGAWMDHPSFGLGRVQRRLGRKVDVLFRDGLKTLVSA